jgi:hypothetical protein
MSCPGNLDSYWAGRVATVQALITAYDGAILALATGAQSYELDTGQTRSRKTAADLGSLRAARDALLNELSSLDARVNGATTHLIPGF